MLEALERIERQLIDAAAPQRQAAEKPRTLPGGRARQLVLAGAIGLVVAAGASAVTGVGPFGDLFDAEEIGLAPAPGGASVTVTQERPRGGQAAMRAYEDKRGALCIESPPVAGPPESEVAVRCAPPAAVRRAIERDAVFAATSVSADGAEFYGLAPEDTKTLRVEVEGLASDATFGEESIDGVRPFLVALPGTAPDIDSPALLTFDGGRQGHWPPPED